MTTQFKPWRRKTGIITLVIALAFAAGWIRSLTDQDVLARMNVADTHLFISQHGRISWARIWPISRPRPNRWFYRHDTNPGWEPPMEGEGCHVHWIHSGLGFDVFATSMKYQPPGLAAWTEESVTWSIPYWFIVIPLTTLSAWLLLGKQPPTKPDNRSIS